jgi:prevent-host-death family protein
MVINVETLMKTISVSDAQSNWSELLEQAKHEPVAIQKQGGSTAVLLSYEEYERLTQSASAAG